MNDTDALLADQVAYYRAAAAEYHLDEPAARDLATALDEFRPAGDVLELACGPGTWTRQLLRHAATVTALDAAPEMLARAQARVGEGRVLICPGKPLRMDTGSSSTTSSSSASGCPTFRLNGSTRSGPWCEPA